MTESRNVLILGIGNSLLRDEGAGIHALNRLREELAGHDDISFIDGGTLSFALAGHIEDASRLIVIDAAQLDAAPGHSRVFEGEAMDEFLGGNRKRSVHEVSLLDLMAIALLADHLPQRRALIGIQPAEIDWGEHPSAAVAAAMPQVCAQARKLIEEWRT
ncbi:MAG: peptidase M52 [Gallionellales bacterium GWA2_60_142]|nr:MAG: peptidase M52 [Gallionellales bacterium GWA2_60_142]HCI13378.1 peptidase M52 [Gallionellaceae bacterium]